MKGWRRRFLLRWARRFLVLAGEEGEVCMDLGWKDPPEGYWDDPRHGMPMRTGRFHRYYT